MKLKTIFILIASALLLFTIVKKSEYKSSHQSLATIHYTLTPHPETQTPHLEVNMIFPGETSGKTLIELPLQWAGENYLDQIQEIIIHSSTAKITKLEDKPAFRIIHHTPSEELHLSYKVYPTPTSHQSLNVTQVIMLKDLYHIAGGGTFILPTFSEKEKKSSLWGGENRNFVIKWQGLPEEWTTISSHGIGEKIQFEGTISDLFSIYVTGKVRVYPFQIQNQPVYLSLYGKFDFTSDEILKQDLQSIINSQRMFFNDHQFPYFLISMIEGNDPNRAGGTAFTNSFAMFYPKTHSIPNDHLLGFSHEHFHTWVGHKIHGTIEDEGLNYWWSEGFTEYHSKNILFQNKQISLEKITEEYNTMLLKYFLSPVINEPNKKIKEAFWISEDIKNLPYNRGFVFAFLLDGLIRKNTLNQHSLADLTQDLFNNSQKTKQPFTPDLLEKLATKYIPMGIQAELQAFIEEGATISLAPLMSELPIKIVKKGSFDLGFSLDSLVNKKIIENIDPKSNAYQAGLRNGQAVTKRDLIHLGDANQLLNFVTEGKEIKFRPESPKKLDVPQIQLSNEEDIEKMKAWFFINPK